jgi:hypothetical protein
MYAPKEKGKKPAPKRALVVKEKIYVKNRLQTRHVLTAKWGGACLPSACLVSAGDTRLLIGCAFEGQSIRLPSSTRLISHSSNSSDSLLKVMPRPWMTKM